MLEGIAFASIPAIRRREAVLSTALAYNKTESQNLATEVMERSGQNLMACYQCRRCAAGCPVADSTGITPDILIRRIIMGDRQGALENLLVWQCVSCYTCGTRCPNKIQTARITETLKKMASEDHTKLLRPRIKSFHNAFCASARHFGRVNEMEFMGLYEMKNTLHDLKTLRPRALFQELKNQAVLGYRMIRKKRLHLSLQRVRRPHDLKRLYRRAKTRNPGRQATE